MVAKSMPDIDKVIEMSLPEVHMAEGGSQTITNSTEKRIEVNQEINIYSPADDPIETARRLKESQREAAEEW